MVKLRCMGNKKKGLGKKTINYRALIFSSLSAIAFLCLLFFIFWHYGAMPKHEIYVSSENPKQGDTILIKVSGKYQAINGSFKNEKIDFFRSGLYSDWFAFLGIDVNLPPGNYKIFISTLTEQMEKEINVLPQNFASSRLPITKELAEKGFTAKTVAENIVKTDNPALKKALENLNPLPYFKNSFSFPLGKMQQKGLSFGQFVKSGDLQLQHFGVDLVAVPGTEVYSINDGKVVLAKDLANYGKTVIVDHGLGIFSLYLHLSEYKISENQMVKKDQAIGLSGNTGYSTAPHLHFSIRDNGARVNPVLFIKKTQESDDGLNVASIVKTFTKFFNIVK